MTSNGAFSRPSSSSSSTNLEVVDIPRRGVPPSTGIELPRRPEPRRRVGVHRPCNSATSNLGTLFPVEAVDGSR